MFKSHHFVAVVFVDVIPAAPAAAALNNMFKSHHFVAVVVFVDVMSCGEDSRDGESSGGARPCGGASKKMRCKN